MIREQPQLTNGWLFDTSTSKVKSFYLGFAVRTAQQHKTF